MGGIRGVARPRSSRRRSRGWGAPLARKSVAEHGASEAGALYDTLDRQVALVRASDVPDVLEALLLGGRLEDEMTVVEHPSEQRFLDGDVEDPGDRHRGQSPGEHAAN